MRNVDLWKYLPPFLKQFREMVELIATENPEFELFAHNTDALLDEMFIQTATETGLARFEKILGISPVVGSSLDTRRSAIMARWYNVTAYTLRTLRARIVAIQGTEDVVIHIHRENPYVIEIITHLEKQGQVDDLAFIIKSMMPCNMLVQSLNIISGESTVGIGYGVGASLTGKLFLTNDLDENQEIAVPLAVGAGQSITGELVLTDDLTETLDVGTVAAVSVGGSFTNTLEIH